MPEFDYSARLTLSGELAQKNWDRLREHTTAEWRCDIEGTMASMAPEPFQVFHPSGVELFGYDAVRAFYEERFRTFSGQGFFAKRWVVTDEVAVGQGWFKGTPTGPFFGTVAHGKPLFFAMALWIYFEDTLVKGEALYADGAEIERQIREGADGDVRRPLY